MKLNPRTFPLFTQLEAMFFVSGFSALVLEVVFVRLLRYWAGNTAFAIAAVLCAYMAGLATGSHMAGKWLVRGGHLLLIYGLLELTVGVYALCLPTLMKWLEPAYLAVSFRAGPDTSFAVGVHFLAAVLVLLVPTLLMGATFPVVVRAASESTVDRAILAEKLYTTNLAGAALGTVLSDFLLISTWGLGNTLWFVAAVNSVLAVYACLLARRHAADSTRSADQETREGAGGRVAIAALLVALASGFLTLTQEIVWTNLMGRFLDDTVYGFATALFVVIAGLGVGAALVARNPLKRPPQALLPWACLGAGLTGLALTPFWDNARYLARAYPLMVVFGFIFLLGVFAIVMAPVPKTLGFILGAFPLVYGFLWLVRWINPNAEAFWSHHLVVFSVAGLFSLITAILMGMVFPLTLDWYLGAADSPTRSAGTIYAVNTAGGLAGIVAATFLLLPRTGMEWGGRTIACGFVLLGVVLLWRVAGKRRLWALSFLPIATLLLPGSWDYSKDHRAFGHSGELIYVGEDLNGGVTTVLDDHGNHRLYSNGFLQGGIGEVVGDQVRVGMIPMLYVHEFGRALVIGVGSGQSAGVVHLFPFQTIDLVDLSPRVVEAARYHFPDLNMNVLADPRVSVHIADGRHYLLTHPGTFSLITMEASRLWFAGEGDLYTQEFYQLCSAHLGASGILQQWVPLFDLSQPDTLVMLRTIRTVFPYVTFYIGIESGMMVASRSPLTIDNARLKGIDLDPAQRQTLVRIGLPHTSYLLGDCVLTPEGVDALLAREPGSRISTDRWPHLEYSNARFYLGNRSSRPLRTYLLTAQSFRLPAIINADVPVLNDMLADAQEEHARRLRVAPPR